MVIGAGIASVNEWANALDTRAKVISLLRSPTPDEQDLNTPRCFFEAFGIDAFQNRAWTVLTRPGQVLGTLDYLAPELIRGEPASPMSDLYALGCVLYECLSGAPPFAGRGVLRIGMAHLEEAPGDPAAGRADVSPALSWTVRQSLAKDPAMRPPDAGTLARMLRLAAAWHRSSGGQA